MSPEQARGRARARRPHRHLLARLRALRDAGGRAAVHGADRAGDDRAAVHRDAAPAADDLRETVPEGVASAVAKALAQAPADRFASAAEFAQALRDARRGPRRRSRPRPLSATRRPGPPGARCSPLALGARARGLGRLLFGWLRGHMARATSGRRRRGQAARGAPVREPRPAGGRATSPTASPTRSAASSPRLPGLQVTASSSSSQYKKTTKTPQEIGASSACSTC